MKEYRITYLDKNGFTFKAYVEAKDPEGARKCAFSEYSDIETILYVDQVG